ncbi:DUF998 domain-containing protein [Flexibacterium corallicola]|uniref:DUF998 domain-containing protein n=1 Tax=Flexibacterium corallicola TaxID=3037259 RepID=UPI00286F68C3|nr:DUF998 domain-containing protein [Pseudovibrio sp. M1P-2-3]
MKKSDLAVLFAALSYIWLFTTVFLGGAFYPNYSHTSQFMSVLGANGAPFGQEVNLWGFAVVELLLLPSLVLCFVYLMRTTQERLGLVIFAGYPLLLIVAAFFPCDFECKPDDPTRTQLIHMSAGFLSYLCAIVGLSFLSWTRSERPYWGLLSLVLVVMLLNLSPDNALAGLTQRALETGIYLWFMGLILSRRQQEGRAMPR